MLQKFGDASPGLHEGRPALGSYIIWRVNRHACFGLNLSHSEDGDSTPSL